MDPPVQKAFVGSTIVFICSSVSEPTCKLNDGTLPNNSIISAFDTKTYFLEIISIDFNNSGLYTCQGALDYIETYSTGTLEVYG